MSHPSTWRNERTTERTGIRERNERERKPIRKKKHGVRPDDPGSNRTRHADTVHPAIFPGPNKDTHGKQAPKKTKERTNERWMCTCTTHLASLGFGSVSLAVALALDDPGATGEPAEAFLAAVLVVDGVAAGVVGAGVAVAVAVVVRSFVTGGAGRNGQAEGVVAVGGRVFVPAVVGYRGVDDVGR